MGLKALMADARARGDRFFDFGRPCAKGHAAQRYASTGQCVECSIGYYQAEAARKSVTNKVRYKRTRDDKIEQSKKWRERNPHKRHEYRCKSYGITTTDHEAMLKQQSNRCAICGIDFHFEKANIDHCHETGKVRGLLCGPCNRAIGQLRESAEIAELAAAYIRKHK